MELSFSNDIREQVLMLFTQINDAIDQLVEWNDGINSEDDYYESSNGLQKLAASCMMIEAIGETVGRIDKITQEQLLVLRPEIPWNAITGMRNHIAHGYFNIDAGIVFDVIKNNLQDLKKAVMFFLKELKD
ncbi:MAG: DUF86 domain-containing protein [Muribaculaceae bacterium]|nr:DUF86 domain-containing protein [Muribaculaceae bacterium]